MFNGKGGNASTTARKYTRVWRVISDGYADGAIAVREALPVRIFQIYATSEELDSKVWCKTIDVKCDERAPFTWIATAEYDSETPKPDQNPENPLDKPAELSWGAEIYQKPVTINPAFIIDVVSYPAPSGAESSLTTVGSAKVLNTADEQFDPPPVTDEARLTLKISKNLAEYDAVTYFQFINSVNQDSFLGFPARAILCTNIAGARQSDKGQIFWKVDFEFHFKFETWDMVILNQGYKTRSAAGVDATPYIDPKSGAKPSSPVLLDKDGVKLAAGAEPTYSKFRIKREMPFAFLNIL